MPAVRKLYRTRDNRWTVHLLILKSHHAGLQSHLFQYRCIKVCSMLKVPLFITCVFQTTSVSHSFINLNPFLLPKKKCEQKCPICYMHRKQSKAVLQYEINPAVIISSKMSNRFSSVDLSCCLSVGLLHFLSLPPIESSLSCKALSSAARKCEV